MRKCRKLVYWQHEDGWDVFRKSDCYQFEFNGEWVPSWFDTAVIEDQPTKQSAINEIKTWHPAGFCLINS